jgi:preprotein translocase subunit YajC
MEIIIGGVILEIGVILEVISTVGFPIAMVIALGIFVFLLWKQSVTREEKLMTEITENRLVNQQAIQTISQYAERLTHIEDNITEIKSDVTVIKEKIDN